MCVVDVVNGLYFRNGCVLGDSSENDRKNDALRARA